MVDSKCRCEPVIQHDVRHTLRLMMARYGNCRYGPLFSKQSIHRNNAFNRAVLKEPLRSLNHLLAMMMTDQEIKIIRLQKMSFDSAQHKGRIALAHLGHQNTDRLAPSIAQRAGK